MDYADLAIKWAPIHYQYVDTNNLGRDLLCKVNFDGDWDASNNRDKAREIDADPNRINQMIPASYYSIAETKSHYFIMYSFYHADDERHENDLEGCLLIVERKTDRLMGMITVAHLSFHRYAYNDHLRGKNGERMRKVIVEQEEDQIHPLTEQERGGHGLYALGRRGRYGKFKYWLGHVFRRPPDIVIYYPITRKDQTIPGHDWDIINKVKGTPHYSTFYYTLVDMLDPNEGLWERRKNPETFSKYGIFNSKSGLGGAHAPWKWDDKFDTAEHGMIWNDPARLVNDYFAVNDGEEIDFENYIKHMYPEEP